jgi:hypothetical protein
VAVNEVLSHLQELLFPSVSGVAVVAVQTDGEAICVEARCTPAGAVCPDCAHWTERVHSSYLRFPADLPAAGRRAAYVSDGQFRDNLHFAAGIAICDAAGCVISDLNGNPLHTGRGLVISADQRTHDRVLALVEPHLRAVRA